jgi:hypothetical protein
VYLKLFTPDSSFTWYLTEGSPIEDDSGRVSVRRTHLGTVDVQRYCALL